jgi:hypothetical protein
VLVNRREGRRAVRQVGEQLKICLAHGNDNQRSDVFIIIRNNHRQHRGAIQFAHVVAPIIRNTAF